MSRARSLTPLSLTPLRRFPATGPRPGPRGPRSPPVPLERLEAQICELAGHLAAATCRFLVLLADALLAVAEAFLAAQITAAEDPEVYQVVVHAGTGALTSGTGPEEPGGVSAETPAPAPRVPGDPADPARCHVEDGPALSVSTAQMLGCTAALSWMRHDRDGAILDLGRRRRRPNAALRRAARERDHCRCRFPGCESRRVDLHHIVHWTHGGRTSLGNLVSLCKAHHTLVHERGYLIAPQAGGAFAFCRPDGTPCRPAPPCRPPTAPSGTATTRTSPRRRSSRRGTASGSTWTRPSTSAWPTPAPRRKNSGSGTRPTTPRSSGPANGS